jgi:hypothetical protein
MWMLVWSCGNHVGIMRELESTWVLVVITELQTLPTLWATLPLSAMSTEMRNVHHGDTLDCALLFANTCFPADM